MMLLTALLILLALIGNLAIWTRAHCILHSMPWKQESIDIIELFIYAFTLLLPGYTAWWYFSFDGEPDLYNPLIWVYTPLFYLPVCWVACIFAIFFWKAHRNEFNRNQKYYSETILKELDLADNPDDPLTHSAKTRLMAKIPGNEILQLAVDRKELLLKNLPESMAGLTISHISDLHLTGHLRPAFYKQVMEQVVELNSDVIMITGDIFDKDDCVDWVEEIFSCLTAKHGVFFILGNHDKRLKNVPAARKSLANLGFVDLGLQTGRMQVGDTTIFLAGNELPWFQSPVPEAELRPNQATENCFRLLLSHTPDRIDWANEFEFKLMLAGHNHGGQIRVPVVGPLVSPSHHGVRFASGVYYCGDTLMHVSRGIAGTHQIRLNCKPEVTQLVLQQYES